MKITSAKFKLLLESKASRLGIFYLILSMRKGSSVNYNSCKLGNFSMFLLLSTDIFQNYIKKKIFQEHYQSVKLFDSGQIQPFVGPDLGPNCLQRLSADGKNRHLQGKS